VVDRALGRDGECGADTQRGRSDAGKREPGKLAEGLEVALRRFQSSGELRGVEAKVDPEAADYDWDFVLRVFGCVGGSALRITAMISRQSIFFRRAERVPVLLIKSFERGGRVLAVPNVPAI